MYYVMSVLKCESKCWVDGEAGMERTCIERLEDHTLIT